MAASSSVLEPAEPIPGDAEERGWSCGGFAEEYGGADAAAMSK